MSDHSNLTATDRSTLEDDSAHQLHLGFDRVKAELDAVMVEEALRTGIPVLMVDVKGDLPNLALAFAEEREQALNAWGIGEAELRAHTKKVQVRVLTPGSTAGEPLRVLSSLESPSADWHADPESARSSLSAAVSLLLRLLGRDPDPAKSRDHVLLSVLAERRLQQGLPSELGFLLADVLDPPVDTIGSLPVDSFVSKRERADLAAALNTLLASPTFAT